MKISVPPIATGLLLAFSTTARAQVGHLPSRSPYFDLETKQELTLLVGDFHGHRDPANVGPQSGLLLGAHYEFRAGGPAYLVTEVARISSQRRVINPLKVGDGRELGTTDQPLYTADVGLGLALTGAKSWHHVVPVVGGGLGFISDFRGQADSGGYKFGTRFALHWGGGIRVVPGGGWQIRFDVKNRLYTIAYPEAFFIEPANGGAVVPSTQSKSFWLNNPAFTLGLSRLF